MAKDFAHEYERMINGKAFVGVAIYNDHRDGLDSQESQKDRIVSELRSAGFTARVFSGIYGSRYYGTAIELSRSKQSKNPSQARARFRRACVHLC